MSLFKKEKDDFFSAPLNDFEELLHGKKEKTNPIVKGGSMVLYLTVAVAVLACAVMLVLDLAGKTALGKEAPTDTKVEVTEPVDVSSYPESLQKLYKENFEAADFVVSYPKEKDKNKKVSLKGYKKVNAMPLFLQWDKQWGYMQYGGDFAGITADGPMCFAMIGYHFTGDEKFSPDKIITYASENNYYKKGFGTHPLLFTNGSAEFGLSAVQITPSSENIIASLQNGSAVVCYMGPGTFATTSRYVVIHSFSDGYLMINDPNSKINSEKQWLFTDIASQIKGAWEMSLAS